MTTLTRTSIEKEMKPTDVNTREVKRQYPPFFIVKSAGTCVEFTDDRATAHSVYASANDLDKGIWKVDATGFATCVRRMIGGKELGATTQTP